MSLPALTDRRRILVLVPLAALVLWLLLTTATEGDEVFLAAVVRRL